MQIFRQPGFLTPAQCLEIRRGMDAGEVEPAEVLAGGIQRDGEARVASLVEPSESLTRDIEARLDAFRARVAEALGISLGEREGAGFIRYPAGGFYRAHRDRGDDPQWPPAARRAAAVVLFLSASRASGTAGDFDGGILRLHLPDGTLDVAPEPGLLVAFPADVLHEVTEVRDGTRDTIVDWFYDP
jgi:predicted 2-oxoglutarate/Fe(II)-dependent dioxygenase YbiX